MTTETAMMERRGRPTTADTVKKAVAQYFETNGAELRNKMVDFYYIKRTVGPSYLEDGTIDGAQLNAAIKDKLDAGWDLHSVHFTGPNKDGQGNNTGDQFVFILVKYA